jgi:hypothetical protein
LVAVQICEIQKIDSNNSITICMNASIHESRAGLKRHLRSLHSHQCNTLGKLGAGNGLFAGNTLGSGNTAFSIQQVGMIARVRGRGGQV